MKRSLAYSLFAALTLAAFTSEAQISTDSTTSTTPTEKPWLANRKSDFEVSLGLNTLTGNIQDPELRPLGSRFVSLGSMHQFRISHGKNAGFVLKTGVEVSWNNLMFEGNRTVMKDNGQLIFPETSTPLSKSKLTVAYLNVPVMPTVVFRKGVFTSIGVGGYVGMRLDSYTKTKTLDGTKSRDHNSYYLNNFRYGVGMDLGIRGVAKFFVQYDLNQLFDTNHAPQAQVVSFGIRL